MAMSAKASGFRIAVLDPTPGSPCGQVADLEITAEYNDLEALKKLADISDVITFEFENINGEALDWLTKYAYVPQGSELLKISQNRIFEKKAITDAGAEVAPYAVIRSMDDLHEQAEEIGFPAVLKTATGGYDGKGQLVLKDAGCLEKARVMVEQCECVLEAWLPFEKEISVIVSRNVDGDVSVFPVAENIHKENILFQTIVPARISEDLERKAIEKAMLIANHVSLAGTLAVEMFVMENGEIYINELAPRPHNSGHYTMDACETSQFEQHIRAVCNWKLANTGLLKPVVMGNILGGQLELLLAKIPELVDWKIHLYGKAEARDKRKMGHVNIVRDNIETALMEAEQSKIWESGHRELQIGGNKK